MSVSRSPGQGRYVVYAVVPVDSPEDGLALLHRFLSRGRRDSEAVVGLLARRGKRWEEWRSQDGRDIDELLNGGPPEPQAPGPSQRHLQEQQAPIPGRRPRGSSGRSTKG